MPALRTDLIHVYPFRLRDRQLELMQFRRTQEPLRGTWQPVMGHLHEHESAINGAARELLEETGLELRSSSCIAWYALEGVHPFFLPHADAVVLSPSFAVHVHDDFSPRLCEEHDAWRWIEESKIESCLMWPGQQASAREIRSLVISGVLRALDR